MTSARQSAARLNSLPQMSRNKLMRAKQKFGRCTVPGHGQKCSVAQDIRRPCTRADDRRDCEEELKLAQQEMTEL